MSPTIVIEHMKASLRPLVLHGPLRSLHGTQWSIFGNEDPWATKLAPLRKSPETGELSRARERQSIKNSLLKPSYASQS